MINNQSSDTLEVRLRKVEAEKHGSYDKRTEHLDDQGKGLFINRLILEDSPYLLQHAHNPVNWYPWGDEAFAAAAAESKPVFLSIGYATCHWCHVMEVETFDNVEVAKLLNEGFISIKMDREQYPDIDEIYMTGVQIMSGQGGWPMSNFLLEDGKPFYGATYFPAASFIHLLQQITLAWQGKHAELKSSAQQITSAIDRILSERKQAADFDPNLAETTLKALLQREDRSFGGLAGAPKFPQEPLLLLMLDRVARNRELETLAFTERALDGMATGGIYDQVAGGFHRYSVDAQWLVPHFEKMLYNQSQLGLVYLQAFQYTGNHFFRRVCEQILNYVLRDMQLPEGGFYSATDADSEGVEGTFFVWSIAELKQILLPAEFEFIDALYDLSAAGNFEGSNILSLQHSLRQSAQQSKHADFYGQLDSILQKLYDAREQRIHPLRDDKLIVAWTGAMISTLARASYVFENPAWLDAAQRAAHLVWEQNVDPHSHSLKRIYLNRAVSINGQLEDYANLSEGLISLFDISGHLPYLKQAQTLMLAAVQEFWDEQNGGFFLSPRQQEGPLLSRSRNASDGATLSPVATALNCLLMLRQRQALLSNQASSADDALTTRIDTAMAGLIAALNDNPLSHPSLLRVFANQQRGAIEPVQYAGQGLAKIMVRRLSRESGSLGVAVNLQIQSGWHVTAPQGSAGNFVSLDVHVDADEQHWQLQSCDYPVAEQNLDDGEGGRVPIYAGTIEFIAQFTRTDIADDALAGSIGIGLTLQLCNESSCQLPQTLCFRI